MATLTWLKAGRRIMNLIHRVGAGLIVVGGLLPVQAHAQWPLAAGCGQCGTPAPMAPVAPLFGSQMFGAAACGAQQYGPRMHRPWVYRSHTRTRMSGPAMFGSPTMGLPMGDCSCGSAPMMMPQQAPLMAPQAFLCPQQVTTYLEVPKTVMRQEAVQVQVPITTYKQVAVDEGGYQQVWVPRLVTKNVPQTIPQTQVQYRQVPQTVMERVPQVSTQWLPQQTMIGSVYAPSVASYPIATPTTVTPVPEYNPAPLNPVPNPVGDSAAAPRPVAPQTSQVQEWQKVRQRQPTIEQQKYEYEAQAEPQTEGYRVPQAAGRFSSKR